MTTQPSLSSASRGLASFILTESRREKVQLKVKDAKKFWKTFRFNRLGFAGFLALVAFMGIAVLAPELSTVGLAFSLTFYTMPTFVLALGLVIFFGGTLGWFPLKGPYGEIPFYDNPPNYADMSLIEKIASRGYHLVLPVLIMRNSLTDVLTEDYITTARAKGLSDEEVLRDHAMRNALLPVVTVIAITVGWIVGGEIMVELIFSYEGIGQLTYDAVYYRDFPMLQALFLLISVGVLMANFLADVVYTRLDPRVSI